MDIREKNILVYRVAYHYLLEIKPSLISEEELHRYFVGGHRDFSTMKDIFEQFICSAQNYQQMPNVIKYYARKEKIKSILYDFDLKRVSQYDVEELYQKFRREFNITSADNKKNSWHKWSQSIVDVAKFVSEFEDTDDFKHFINLFEYNLPTRMALPLLISTKISGIGFALACDCLKELGYSQYPKPDVHLSQVMSSIGMCSKDKISTFEAIVRMADDCKDVDPEVTPFKIDKIIWLICSGRFYLHDIMIKRHKEAFISLVKQQIS